MERFVQTLTGEKPGEAGRARINLEGRSVTVDVFVDKSRRIDLRLVGKVNDPKEVTAFSNVLQNLSGSGAAGNFSFKLTPRARYHARRARVSDLRAAYLACFARFGIRYGFHKVLDLIRDQLANPDELIIDRWWTDESLLSNQPAIAVFVDPGVVIVAFHRRTVFLPWPSTQMESYIRLTKLGDGQSFTFERGKEIPWPTSFEAMLDHDWQKRWAGR